MRTLQGLLLAGCAALLVGCGASLNDDGTGTLTLKASETRAASSIGAQPGSGEKPAPSKGGKTAEAFTSAATPGNTAYKMGPQDVVEISVFKVPDLSKMVQLADSGTINLPLLGEVPAAGLTAQELERSLTTKLGSKYLQNPQVTVYVKEFNSQRVTVEGAVKKPGVYPLRGKTSLLQTIAMAEGLDPNADSTVMVLRQVDGKRAAARFDVNDLRGGQGPDPLIQAGDVVVVGTSAIKEGFNNFVKVLPLAGIFAAL